MNEARWERQREQERKDERERQRPVTMMNGAILDLRPVEVRVARRKLEGHRHHESGRCTCGRTTAEIEVRRWKKRELRKARRRHRDRRGW